MSTASIATSDRDRYIAAAVVLQHIATEVNLRNQDFSEPDAEIRFFEGLTERVNAVLTSFKIEPDFDAFLMRVRELEPRSAAAVWQLNADMGESTNGRKPAAGPSFLELMTGPMPKPIIAKFELGRVVITANAKARLKEWVITAALRRHAAGDWGSISADDRCANDRAITDGDRILSIYPVTFRARKCFWIITDADRSATTILMPEDY
jgi:hypothetical protein